MPGLTTLATSAGWQADWFAVMQTGFMRSALIGSTLVALALFTALLAVGVGVVARPLTFASVDPQVAQARGVPVRALGIVFVVLLALAVTMAVQVVGTLLLFALVVTPSATALLLTPRPGRVMALGTLLSAGSVWGGLVLSAMFNLPPSFFIVSLAVSAWLVTLVVTGDRRRSRHQAHGEDVDRHHGHAHRPGRLV